MASASETVVVVQHQDDAGPGNLADWLHDNALPWQLVDIQTGELPQPARHRALVVLGSKESAYDPSVPWAEREREFVRAEIAAGTPVLGICYGAQVLAQVLGGQVRPAGEAERGWKRIAASGPHAEVLSGCWFEWHGDEIVPPPDAAVHARDTCVQAFSLGRHLGVQFHPEVTQEQIHAWLRADRRLRQLTDAGGDPEALVRATAAQHEQAQAAAGRLYTEFLRSADDRASTAAGTGPKTV